MKPLLVLLAFASMLGVAQARPVFVENVSTIPNPNPAVWQSFPGSVAVDGDYALVGAGYLDYSNPQQARAHVTAFLYRRSGVGWSLVRQLDEAVVDCCTGNGFGLAMRDGVAAVNYSPMKVYELGPSGWTQAPSDIPVGTNSGSDVRIDNGRIITNEGACSWDGGIVEKSADGVWRKAATLAGSFHDCESTTVGSVDILGNRAIVHQYNNLSSGYPYGEEQTWIFRRNAGGWAREGVATVSFAYPHELREFLHNTRAAISGPDVLVASGIVNGINVYRNLQGQGFTIADHIRPADSAMGAGESAVIRTSGDYLLQKTVLTDRYATVLNVYRRGADARYEHTAALIRRGAIDWDPWQPGTNIAISGRTVLAGDYAAGVVYHFELPATQAPEALQDTFNAGLPSNWMTSAGSQYVLTRGDRSRVLRQSQSAIDTRAIFEPADWTNEAIEVDVKASQFTDNTSAISLITRWQGPHNFYEFLWGPTRMEFRRMASGTLRTLWSVTPFGGFPTGRNFRMRLESIGTRHLFYIDGQLRFGLHSTGPTRGRVGIATYGARADFDNVQVTPTPLYSIYRNYFPTTQPVPFASQVGDWQLFANEHGAGVETGLEAGAMDGEARVSMGAPSADQRVEANARVKEFAAPTGTQRRWFGVVARYVDEDNHYTLALRNSNSLVLSKRVNGQDTTLGSFAVNVVPDQDYLIRLDAIGDQLRAYLDNRLLFEVSDGAHASGSPGLAAFKVRAQYSQFVAYQP